jgi:hypothetical protein
MLGGIGELTQVEWHALRPYLAERRARNGKNGPEWALHCPLHEDDRPSAELNPVRRQWYCNRGCGGGSVNDLMAKIEEWVPAPPEGGLEGPPSVAGNGRGETLPSRRAIMYWNERLLKHCPEQLAWLQRARGLSLATIRSYKVGYDDMDMRCYTIPVFGFKTAEILDVRRYYPNPKPGYGKIRSVAGHGEGHLYPAQMLRRIKPGDTVIIGEGEWDCLLTRQHTEQHVFVVTAAAGVWKDEWSSYFKDTEVFICMDRDDAGELAALKVAGFLEPYAATQVIKLPYPMGSKKDLTDFWLDRRKRRDRGRKEFNKLLGGEENNVHQGTIDDARNRRLKGKVMTVGNLALYSEKEPYSVPRQVTVTCNDGDCSQCPRGELKEEFKEGDPRLSMFPMQDADVQRKEIVRMLLGRPCAHAKVEVLDDYAARSLWVYDRANTGSMVQVMLFDDGRTAIPPQAELEMVGYPGKLERHKNVNVFLANKMVVSNQHPLGAPGALPLRQFRDKEARPLVQCDRLAAANELVTDVYGHRDMQIMMDLVLHSVSGFHRRGKLISGVLDAIVVGADRTGKTQMVKNLLEFLDAGELMQGEALSFAGLVGGSEKIGERHVGVPGALPRNHEGFLCLDEIQKASKEVRDGLSSARGSRMVVMGKMGRNKWGANTRLLMIGNPVEGLEDAPMFRSLSRIFTRRPDIARFDMALGVGDIDVERAMILATREEVKPPPQQWSQELLWWCWTRKPEQVVLPRGTMVRKQAVRMKRKYPFNDTRLVDPGSVDVKILRVACAMAARTFSTDATRTKVIVTDQHVVDATEFMMRLYDDPVFGLGIEAARKIRRDQREIDDVAWFVERLKNTSDGPRFAEWLCDPDAWPLDTGSVTKLLPDRHVNIGELVRRRLLAPQTSNARNMYPVPALISALLKEGLAE